MCATFPTTARVEVGVDLDKEAWVLETLADG